MGGDDPKYRHAVGHGMASVDRLWWTLRIFWAVFLVVTGVDKFIDALVDWDAYFAPQLEPLLGPVPVGLFLDVGGVGEVLWGLGMLTPWVRAFAYTLAAMLVATAANLVLAGFADVALRDVGLAVLAYATAAVTEIRTGQGWTWRELLWPLGAGRPPVPR